MHVPTPFGGYDVVKWPVLLRKVGGVKRLKVMYSELLAAMLALVAMTGLAKTYKTIIPKVPL